MGEKPTAPIVLIVEDEWLIRADIAYEFQAAGWTTLEVASGEEALAMLREGRTIDVLVTDIRLSGTANGWDVALAFRKAWPHLPVLYASANVRDEDQMVPGSVFFSKPFPSSTLVEASFRLVNNSAD